MGWFDEQIRQRAQQDDERFARAFADMAGAVLGRPPFPQTDSRQARGAIMQIIHYYRLPPPEDTQTAEEIPEQLARLTAPLGLMHRRVRLAGAWYKNAIGPMLGATREGKAIALLPGAFSGYSYLHPDTGKRIRLNARTAAAVLEDAICFYRPFPLRKLGSRDLLVYIVKALSRADLALVFLAAFLITGLGLLLPRLNLLLFGPVLKSGSSGFLMPVASAMVGVIFSMALITTARMLLLSQIQTRLDLMVQSAAMMRVLSLPASFFKGYNAGELTSRVRSVGSLCSLLVSISLTGGLSSLMSLAYLGQVVNFAPSLAVPALAIVLSTLAVSIVSTFAQVRYSQERMELGAKESGMVFSLISSVQKIKLAGAEKRAFAKWADSYTKGARLQYEPPFLIRFGQAIPQAIALLGTVLIYFTAVKSGVGTAGYMAFSLSFGMVSGAFASLAGMVSQAAELRPMFRMIDPLLKAVPEASGHKKSVRRLSGGVEINNVSFRYHERMPHVLHDLTLKIRPGEYVAIVGRTGSGKSTIIRLLLGFEQPQRGAIYYDGQDMATLDLRGLRRHMGVVTQDGKLFQGDVFSNIAISAPGISLKEAWEAAETAGIAQDIREMRMGMHTLLSEGEGGVSGGQRQRLMIARAIASKPRILLLDEATSALDNITQKQVSDSLERLKCTRIVVAHRLSTIRQCGRVLVLEEGRIAEDGTYDELVARGGIFTDLVSRQQLVPDSKKTGSRA